MLFRGWKDLVCGFENVFILHLIWKGFITYRLVSFLQCLVCSSCGINAVCVCVCILSVTNSICVCPLLCLPQMVKWVTYQWGVDAVCGKNWAPPFRPACPPPPAPLTTFHRRPPGPAHREPELGTHKEGLAEAYRTVGGFWLTGEFCATVGLNLQKKSHAGKQPESNCVAVCCQSQA